MYARVRHNADIRRTVMASERLTDQAVRVLVAPESGNRILYDGGRDCVRGFGLRVTANGAKSFVLNYYVHGRERRYTIGSYPTWSVSQAREKAKALRRQIDEGKDPLGEREAARSAPTVAQLADRYLSEYAAKKKRTASDDAAMIERRIKPALGARKVASVTFSDISRLHRSIAAPYSANRHLSLLTTMFGLAVRWKLIDKNPCSGVEKNPEQARARYLSPAEIARLFAALDKYPDAAPANAIRLLALTGSRLGEMLRATWTEFPDLDADAAIWIKPSTNTKQAREHRVPISEQARLLLVDMRAAAEAEAKAKSRLPSRFVFPAPAGPGPRKEIDDHWHKIRRAAGLEDVRLHDLRHSFASILVTAALSLPIIGAMLGHSKPATTARYAHLADTPLRAAAEVVAKVVPLRQPKGS